jgi:hypothetical protein
MARDREKKRKIVIGYLRRGQSASAGFAAADSIKIGLSISLLFGRFIFSFSQKNDVDSNLPRNGKFTFH